MKKNLTHDVAILPHISACTFDKTADDNNFNLLRFLAANLVVYTHCYGLTGKLPNPQQDPFAYLLYLLGNVGVDIFFVISGFLITKSYLSRNNFWVFMRARVLRLYPGLMASLLLACLLIGPLNTTLPLSEYFHSAELKRYFFYNISLVKTVLSLPGVFQDNIYRGNVNGSLWTLPAEARMYLLVAGFGLSGILFRRWLYASLIFLGAALYLVGQMPLPLLSDNSLYYKLSWFFFSGSLFYVYRAYIPQSKYLCISLIALLLMSCLLTETYRHPLYSVTLPYITLWFAFNVNKLQAFNKIGDYSYGIYIYAFPIQQTVISHIPSIQVIPLYYLSLLLTLALAIPSWHFLEKPALQYKLLKKTGQKA
jgi:peptidoglycan/LPS O-acetylase OafA/YrhL